MGNLWTNPQPFGKLSCMARTPKNHEAAEELGQRLTALSDANGDPKPKDIELWIWEAFRTSISAETIRKAHIGDVDPWGCQPELIYALAAFYDVDVKELGPNAARRTFVLRQMEAPPEKLPSRTPRIHGPSSAVQLDLFGLAS